MNTHYKVYVDEWDGEPPRPLPGRYRDPDEALHSALSRINSADYTLPVAIMIYRIHPSGIKTLIHSVVCEYNGS